MHLHIWLIPLVFIAFCVAYVKRKHQLKMISLWTLALRMFVHLSNHMQLDHGLPCFLVCVCQNCRRRQAKNELGNELVSPLMVVFFDLAAGERVPPAARPREV